MFCWVPKKSKASSPAFRDVVGSKCKRASSRLCRVLGALREACEPPLRPETAALDMLRGEVGFSVEGENERVWKW